MTQANPFPHQQMDVYKVAREICMRVYAAKISNRELRDQAERAASGMFLRLAEGLPIQGAGLRKKYFTEAHAGLHELVAALDLASLAGFMNTENAGQIMVLAERTRRMLNGLFHPRGKPASRPTACE